MIYTNIESEQRYRNILIMVKKGMNKRDICSKLNINEQTYYKYMQKGETEGHVQKCNYIILPAFEKYLKNNDYYNEIEKLMKNDLTLEKANTEEKNNPGEN
jgi:DNA-binding CsgD family transcriptional regulator